MGENTANCMQLFKNFYLLNQAIFTVCPVTAKFNTELHKDESVKVLSIELFRVLEQMGVTDM